MLFTGALLWKIFGLFGQFFFSTRIIIQWWASERVKKSVIPQSFWLLSFIGGMILFIYALHLGDIVFIIGHSLGLAIYARNLWFVYKGNPE